MNVIYAGTYRPLLPHTLTTRSENDRKAMMRLHFFTRPKFSTKNKGGSIEIRASRQNLQNIS